MSSGDGKNGGDHDRRHTRETQPIDPEKLAKLVDESTKSQSSDDYAAAGASISDALRSLTGELPATPRTPSGEHRQQRAAEDQQRSDKMLKAVLAFAQGEYTRARDLCREVVVDEPEHREAAELLERIEEALLKEAERQLADLERVPVVQLGQQEISSRQLDHRQGFLLSQIDGSLSYSEVITVSGMPRGEALGVLAELLAAGIIASR